MSVLGARIFCCALNRELQDTLLLSEYASQLTNYGTPLKTLSKEKLLILEDVNSCLYEKHSKTPLTRKFVKPS